MVCHWGHHITHSRCECKWNRGLSSSYEENSWKTLYYYHYAIFYTHRQTSTHTTRCNLYFCFWIKQSNNYGTVWLEIKINICRAINNLSHRKKQHKGDILWHIDVIICSIHILSGILCLVVIRWYYNVCVITNKWPVWDAFMNNYETF